ncbi:DUF4430 domain-containing protein [Candidatus Saccharibacteria bacterium]|nr:DUF4430 domain-containing protein [Candidatus Saccharibacteria bacterium]
MKVSTILTGNFKQSIRFKDLAILGIVLIMILATFATIKVFAGQVEHRSLSNNQQQSLVVDHQDQSVSTNPTSSESNSTPSQEPTTQSDQSTPAATISDSNNSSSQPEPNIAPQLAITNPNPPTNPSSQPNPEPIQPETLNIKLQINTDSVIPLKILAGLNHCQLLEQAHSQGKISQLNIRYFPEYSSMGVISINNIGDANQVYWTYKVNGAGPPLGCSQVLVKSGDFVLWEYQGK